MRSPTAAEYRTTKSLHTVLLIWGIVSHRTSHMPLPEIVPPLDVANRNGRSKGRNRAEKSLKCWYVALCGPMFACVAKKVDLRAGRDHSDCFLLLHVLVPGGVSFSTTLCAFWALIPLSLVYCTVHYSISHQHATLRRNLCLPHHRSTFITTLRRNTSLSNCSLIHSVPPSTRFTWLRRLVVSDQL